MVVRLHKQARTTPAIRVEIQAAPASVSNPEIAARYGATLPYAVTPNSHDIDKFRQTALQVIVFIIKE